MPAYFEDAYGRRVEPEVGVTLYGVRAFVAGSARLLGSEPTEIHDFIMEALAEGRIDLAKANLLLSQCRDEGEAFIVE